MTVDSDDEEQERLRAEGWMDMTEGTVFKAVSFRWRLVQDPKKRAPLSEYRPKHTSFHRSFCTVRFCRSAQGTDGEGPQEVDFILGETHGYPHVPRKLFRPPADSEQVDVQSWVTEAALRLSPGDTAEFESMSERDGSGPPCRCTLTLLAASATQDILGDEGIVVRILDPSPGGEKPRDLATIVASWRVWFKRNGELIHSTSSSRPLTELDIPPDVGDSPAGEAPPNGTVRFTLDDNAIMVALELGFKNMECGSRACVRVSETWGHGPLTPDGNPVLQGAAIWAELRLHSVKNEPAPGEHESSNAAIAFALRKKVQGNESLALGSAAAASRAVRRYEAGIKALEAMLPDDTGLKGSTKTPQKGPLAADEQMPLVQETLLSLRLNGAQGQLKSQNWAAAAGFCDVVLRNDSNNLKARYRRGLARCELGDLPGSVEDLKFVAHANPNDANVRKELARVLQCQRDHKDGEKQVFGGAFDKMRQKEQDAQKREEAKQEAKARVEEARRAQIDAERKKTLAEAAAAAQESAPTSAEPTAGKVTFGPEPPPAEQQAPVPGALSPEQEQRAQEAASAILRQAKADYAAADADDDDDDEAPARARLPVSEEGQKLLESMGSNTSASATPTLINDLQSKPTEAPPPIDYDVPSFLRKKAKPSSQKR